MMIDCLDQKKCGVRRHHAASSSAFRCGATTGAARTGPSPASIAPAQVGSALRLAGLPVPTASFGEEDLYHVGFLDPAGKKGLSYEGAGLSVSMHPEDWSVIARLPGPTWSVSRQGNTFLDRHSLTPEQQGAIIDWGLNKGYVERTDGYRMTWEDEESEEQVSMLFATEEEAQEEFETYEGLGAVLTSESLLTATDTFPDSTVSAGDLDPFDILTTVWAASETDFDGVWWEDTYDPDALSAPRGVLLPDKIAEWSTTRAD